MPDYTQYAQNLLKAMSFRGVDPEALGELLKQCVSMQFNAGQKICNEGEKGGEMYFLLSGKVQVTKRTPTGETVELGDMEAPMMVGHMALVDKTPRSASCVARTSVDTLVLNQQRYNDILKRPLDTSRAFRRLMLCSLSRQLVQGNARFTELLGIKAPGSSAPAEPGAGPAAPPPEPTEQDIYKASSTFEGWQQSLVKELSGKG